MSEVKHSVSIDLDVDTRRAESNISKAQALLDKLGDSAGSVAVGGSGGPGGGRGGGRGGGGGGAGPGGGGTTDSTVDFRRDSRGMTAEDRRTLRGTVMGAGVVMSGARTMANAISMEGQITPAAAMTREARITASAAQMTGGAMMASTNPLVYGAGTVTMAGATMALALTERKAAAITALMGGTDRYARLETGMLQASRLGFGGLGGKESGVQALIAVAEQYGLTPEEALGRITGFAQSAGMQGASVGGPAELMRLTNAGFGAGALGAYAGRNAAGFGGYGGSTNAAAGLAYGEGLRGSKADEFLMAIVANTRAMATQGIRMDVSSAETFIAAMRGATGSGKVGMYGPQAVAGLMGGTSGALQTLTAPFAELGQSAVMAAAMSESDGTITGLMKAIESYDSPEKVRRAILKITGGNKEIATATIKAMTNVPTGMAADIASEGFGESPLFGGVRGFSRADLSERTQISNEMALKTLRASIDVGNKTLEDIRNVFVKAVDDLMTVLSE